RGGLHAAPVQGLHALGRGFPDLVPGLHLREHRRPERALLPGRRADLLLRTGDPGLHRSLFRPPRLALPRAARRRLPPAGTGPLIARPGRSGPGVQLAPRARGGPPGPVTASGRRGPGPGHGERRMGRHLAIVVLVAVLGGADPAQARQRAVVGLGAGGGVILGTRLLEANGPDGASPGEIREVNLEDTPVASAHAEWYVIPHLALRG